MSVSIILTDDWELRGNGCGKVHQLQKIPALKLIDLYDELDVKSTFNIEVMQQLSYLKYAKKDAFIYAESKVWENTVKEFIKRGFDIQLHIHPQWLNSERINGFWKLNKSWNIVDFSKSEIEYMIKESINYLHSIDKNINLTSFRGGSWGVGPPSNIIQNVLKENNINIDMSIANGLHYEGNSISLDYRKIESANVPYITNIFDVRKISNADENSSNILEIPTQSISKKELVYSLLIESILKLDLFLFKEFLNYLLRFFMPRKYVTNIKNLIKLNKKVNQISNLPDFVETDPFGFNNSRSGSSTQPPVIDLSSKYNLKTWKIIIDCCLKRAYKLNKNTNKELIIIFENHTKDLQSKDDFNRIRTLLNFIKFKYPKTKFKTISDINKMALKSNLSIIEFARKNLQLSEHIRI